MNMPIHTTSKGLVIVEEKALTRIEKSRLGDLEMAITDNFLGFVIVGTALAEINEQRLYRNKDGRTFDGYCQEMWHINARRAYQLMKAAKVIDNVNNCSHSDGEQKILLPKNEGQVRELTRLPSDEQGPVWLKFIEESTRTKVKPTAQNLRKVVQKHKGVRFQQTIKKESKVPVDQETQISPAFEEVWNQLWQQVEIERQNDWKDTSKTVVCDRLRILLDVFAECGGKGKVQLEAIS